jgi:hypothetical protein
MPRTELAARLETYESALADDDWEQAAYEALAAAEIDVGAKTDTLADLKTALENDNDETARILLDQLETQFDSDVAAESRVALRARAALEEYDREDPLYRELETFTQATSRVKTNRSRLLIRAAVVLEPDRSGTHPGDRQVAIDTVEKLISAENTLDQRAERVKTAANAVTLPATVGVLDVDLGAETVDPDKSTTATVVVGNVGDEATGEVTVTGSAVGPASLSPSEQRVATVPAGGQESVEFTVEATDLGTVLLEAEVRGEAVGSDARTGVLSVDDTASESGVPRSIFDAVVGDDGSLGRGEVVEVIDRYVRDRPVAGVEPDRSDVLSLLRFFVAL